MVLDFVESFGFIFQISSFGPKFFFSQKIIISGGKSFLVFDKPRGDLEEIL